MKTKTYKPQLWKRTVHDPEIGEVQQFIEHTADGHWRGWESYEDGIISAKVAVEQNFIPLGYQEVTV